MSGLLDTNIIVRYLTGEPAHLFAQATELIDNEEGLLVTAAVIAEVSYVLVRFYRLPREVVIDHLMALLQRENIETFRLEKAFVLQALMLCRPSGRVSIVDSLTWAAALSSDQKVVYTQDARFPSEGITIREGRP